MFTITGKYNSADVYIDDLDQETISQIYLFCNEATFNGCKIRIMSDAHKGAGCVIGTTMTVNDKLVPNVIGVDVNCGVLVVELGNIELDLEKLDKVIRKYIPSGIECHSNMSKATSAKNEELLDGLLCKNQVGVERAIKSVGTLGGGNHFIEVDKDVETGALYLAIHTGSRNLGKRMAEYYQDMAKTHCAERGANFSDELKAIISNLKASGRQGEITDAIAAYKVTSKDVQISNQLEYLDSYKDGFKSYIHDMRIVQKYAKINRETIANSILQGMFGKSLKDFDNFETVHNYIDLDNMILRKGAISAQLGEKCVIPLNMRDGMLICVGKGNPDWNYSAPHGAGRLFSRSAAKAEFTLDEFKASMEGIFSTTVCQSTLDESPMAYKNAEIIKACILPTVEILSHVKPIYNYKSAESEVPDWKTKKAKKKSKSETID